MRSRRDSINRSNMTECDGISSNADKKIQGRRKSLMGEHSRVKNYELNLHTHSHAPKRVDIHKHTLTHT